MEGLAETWSNIEMRSVIGFLRLKGTSPAEIHRQIVEVVIRRKRPGLLRRGVVLLDINARPHSQPHAWVVKAAQLGGTGPSSLQPWPGTEWFLSLWTIEEAPGWRAIPNQRWIQQAVLSWLQAPDTDFFYVCWDGCLGVPVGKMLRQVWWLCRKIISTKAVLLIIGVYIIWINLHNERTCYLIYWTTFVYYLEENQSLKC
jgi:hypothetical protein